ncbi:hypothetical protein J4477_03375 [Candidatus Pacearchaeota archaeon]|nr:hypothetical protein [Candidatus Pacearchaeota archaeon]
MHLRKTNSRCLAVIFLFLYLIIIVYAKEIDLEYPGIINTDEFSISLILNDFPDDEYDVKIDILGDGKRVAKVLDPSLEYKSTYYFVNDLIKNGDNSAILNFKISEDYSGEVDIEVKIRDSKEKTFSFKNYSSEINIINQNEENNLDNEVIEENKVTNKKVNFDEEQEQQEEHDETVKEESIPEIKESQIAQVIYLKSSPQDIKNQEDKEEIEVSKSKNEKIKEYSLYGFTLFLFFVLALLIMKKL